MAQKFGYNGKELSEELGLNTYDFGARNYSRDIARWSNIDALADATGQIHNTPYAYAIEQPTVFDDPDGNCPPANRLYFYFDWFSYSKWKWCFRYS